MSLPRLIKSAFCLGFLGGISIGFAASVEPIPESQLVVLEAKSILPLDVVLFFPELERPFHGQVNFSHKDASDIEYEFFDANGALVWSAFEQISAKKVEHPFAFTDIDLDGEFDVKISVLNKYGDVLGIKESEIELENGAARLDIMDLAVVDQQELLKVGFLFENDKVSRKVQPKVKIYYGNRSNLLVKESMLEPVGVGGNQKKRFTFDIEKDFAPGLYLLEASVLSSPEGADVTGSLQSSFFKRGNFVKMNEYEFLLDDYTETKKGGLWFTGRILEETAESVEAFMVLRDGNMILSEKQLPLNVNKKGQFTGNFSYTFPELVSQFTAELKIKKGSSVLWEEVLDSPVFEIPSDPIPVVSQDPMVKEKPIKEEEKEIPVYMYTLLIVFVAMIALFFVVRSSRKQTFAWFLLLSTGAFGMGSVFAADVHTVYWSHPVSGWGFSQNSGEFSQLHIEGAVFDPATGNGLFDLTPTETRINFSDGTDDKEYILSGVVYADNRSYQITTDLSAATYSDLASLTAGELSVRILFEKGGTWYATPATTFNIILDSEQPEPLVFNYRKGSLDVAPTNQATGIRVACTDNGIGCFDKGIIDGNFLTATNPNPASPNVTFSRYDVLGNFCAQGTECNAVGAREFEICDAVGNCTDMDNDAEINWYDPIPPEIEDIKAWENLIPHGPAVVPLQRKAFDAQNLDFDYNDPSVVAPAYMSLFEDHACGKLVSGNPTSDFYEEGGICKQREVACVLPTSGSTSRGYKDRSPEGTGDCLKVCPVGYMADPVRSDYCVRECSDDRFHPGAMCFGYNDDSFCLDGACPTP